MALVSLKDSVPPTLVPWIAGSLSGCANLLVGHPFDTVKVRLQTQPEPGKTFRGPIDCLRRTVAGEGILGLYKGVTPPLLGKGMVHSVLFGAFERTRAFMSPDVPRAKTSIAVVTCAGVVAGWCSVVLVTPIDQIKAYLQVQYGSSQATKYRGVADCTMGLVRARGIVGGLYRFWFPTMLEMTMMGPYFGGYEASRRYFSDKCNFSTQHGDGDKATASKSISPIASFLAGGVGGSLFWIVALPFDAVKNQLMTQSLEASSLTSSSTKNIIYRNGDLRTIHQILSQTLARQGVSGLYRGMAPALLRTFPANGATFLTYETVTNIFAENHLK
mmetsp:Transcript_12480/g.20398  ORF Transcript_12480/g.20398 Transcript_12480/m.20398 type:complete len:330 (-) Transcript_12480:312-1301(-)